MRKLRLVISTTACKKFSVPKKVLVTLNYTFVAPELVSKGSGRNTVFDQTARRIAEEDGRVFQSLDQEFLDRKLELYVCSVKLAI